MDRTHHVLLNQSQLKNLKILKCVTIYSIDINESLVANVITAKTYTKNVKESRKNEKER